MRCRAAVRPPVAEIRSGLGLRAACQARRVANQRPRGTAGSHQRSAQGMNLFPGGAVEFLQPPFRQAALPSSRRPRSSGDTNVGVGVAALVDHSGQTGFKRGGGEEVVEHGGEGTGHVTRAVAAVGPIADFGITSRQLIGDRPQFLERVAGEPVVDQPPHGHTGGIRLCIRLPPRTPPYIAAMLNTKGAPDGFFFPLPSPPDKYLFGINTLRHSIGTPMTAR